MLAKTGIFLTALLLLRLVNQYQSVLAVHRLTSWLLVLILVGIPLLHRLWRRLPLRFWEPDLAALAHSLTMFALASLLLFPPFLLAAHCYQTFIFGLVFTPQFPFAFLAVAQKNLFTAVVEEFFFRGWLQPLLIAPLGIRKGLALTALLFAFSHSVIALHWWHFAIFFPALVFGWLREKTGAITASILFHALSNMLFWWVAVCYR